MTNACRWVLGAVLAAVLTGCSADPAPAPAPAPAPVSPPVPAVPSDPRGSIPPTDTWRYSQYLIDRPAPGVAAVNPPRFSWAAVDGVRVAAKTVPVARYRFQVARTADFAAPTVDVVTGWNWHNALAPLAVGQWWWRVERAGAWSAPRSFVIAEQTPTWDRRALADVRERLAARGHPRLAPPTGWAAVGERCRTDERFARWRDEVVRRAEAILASAVWQAVPASDRADAGGLEWSGWVNLARDAAVVACAWQLTGDDRYLAARAVATRIAAFPSGGLTSPEGHGGPRKFSTTITTHLGLVYDWLHPRLDADERRVLREGIAWRLERLLLHGFTLRDGEQQRAAALGVCPGSHPYQNLMWAIPPALAIGDEVAEDRLPLIAMLDYLCGVTVAHGPDGGWNEGWGYANEKGGTMLEATVAVAAALPELGIERNPLYSDLARWYAAIKPVGSPHRLPYGDVWGEPDGAGNMRTLGWITGDGRFAARAAEIWRDAKTPDPAGGAPWYTLLAATCFGEPGLASSPAACAIWPEAGWAQLADRAIDTRQAWQEATGLVLLGRTRGGYSHTYRQESSFVWHAFGEVLAAGGGSATYPDGHARASLSHNLVLVDGHGQEWSDAGSPPGSEVAAERPWMGRFLAWDEQPGHVHAVVDATLAFPPARGVERCIRHVVFVDRRWYAIFDDLARRPEAGPARWSWLLHLDAPGPVDLASGRVAARWTSGAVTAQVVLATPRTAVEVLDLAGRDGLRNPVTGEDWWDAGPGTILANAKRKGIRNLDDQADVERLLKPHNLWITTAPQQEAVFLAALLAAPPGAAPDEVIIDGPHRLTVRDGTGRTRSVSFDPRMPGDITIDPQAYRRFARQTAP